MKPSLLTTISMSFFVRIILCTATVCLFIFGIGPIIPDRTIKTVAIVLFSVGMCTFTTMIIARYVKDTITNPLINRLLESAALMVKASVMMRAAAKGINQNANLLMEFADVLEAMDAMRIENNPKEPKEEQSSGSE